MPFKKELLAFFFTLTVITGGHVFAAIDYQLLAPIDQVSHNEVDPKTGKSAAFTDINTFVPGLIKLAIGVAGGLAVIYIMIGGIQYMTTDAYGRKESARATIEHAIFGLLLAIGAYAILYTVNPNLLKFSFEIQGLKGGEAIDPNAAGTDKKTGEVNCGQDCIKIDPAEFTVTPGACSNDPCYGFAGLVEDLNQLKGLKYTIPAQDPKDPSKIINVDRLVVWQITRAFPPVTPLNQACWQPGKEAGNCIEIAVANTSDTRVAASLISKLQSVYGGSFKFYNICPAIRANALKSDPTLNKDAQGKISCDNSGHPGPERAQLRIN